MFYKPRNLVPTRIPSNPNDVAPTMFFIDLIHSDHFSTPIVPVPSRIDKVSNGELTSIILPSTQPQIHSDNEVYFIDLYQFYRCGLRNLISYSSMKYQEICYRPINPASLVKWWSVTRKYTCNIPFYVADLDFLLKSYLEAYMQFIDSNDEIGSLISFSEKIILRCNERIEQNLVSYQMGKNIVTSKMFAVRRDEKKIPQVWQIDRIDVERNKSRKRAFIPFLVYDDLLECFLSNKAELERGELDIIHFSDLKQLKVLGNQPSSVNENLKEIRLSSTKFDNILVDGI